MTAFAARILIIRFISKKASPIPPTPQTESQRYNRHVLLKAYWNPSKNQTKMAWSRFQNDPRSRSGGSLGGSLAALWWLLDGSWAALVCPMAPRRPWAASCTAPGQLFGGSWVILGASWAVLRPSLAPSWSVFGRLGGILEAFWKDFHVNMEPGWFQNSLNHGSYVKTAEKLKTFIFLI